MQHISPKHLSHQKTHFFKNTFLLVTFTSIVWRHGIRVFLTTLQRIIDANGTYIEDDSKKTARHGVRAEAASIQKKKRESLPVDNAALDAFNGMVQRMKAGGGVSFAIDVQQGDEEIFATSLETRDVEESEDEESNDEED